MLLFCIWPLKGRVEQSWPDFNVLVFNIVSMNEIDFILHI